MNYANKAGIENAIDQVFEVFFKVVIGTSYAAVAYALINVIAKVGGAQ